MRDTIRDYEENQIDKKTRKKAVKIVTAIGALVVAGVVMWQLILPGIAMGDQPHCGIEEHTHSDACYTDQLTCGQEESEEHQHTESCYTRELTCQKEEHTHTDECYSDPTADVESEDTWKRSFANVQLGDDWGDNVAAIAKSQVGYTESEKNYKVDENREHKGYTRYSAWAGDYYRDWDSVFVEFCLHYAGIPENIFPMKLDHDEWIQALQADNLYVGADSGDYQAGDLIFFQKQGQETAKQVGIIEKVEEKNGKTYIHTIEGNCENQVKRNEYTSDDSNILGYGLICKAQMKYKAAQMTQEEAAASEETQAAESTEPEAQQDVQTQEAEQNQTVFYNNDVNANAVATQAENNTTTAEGLNITKNVTDMTLLKKDGVLWVPSTEFTTSDKVKASISFKNVKVQDVKDNNNTVYINLPEGIDCSKFEGTKLDLMDGDKKSGTYEYVKADDGSWKIKLVFEDDYLKEEEDTTINGNLEFEFLWDESSIKGDEEQKNISIGSWSTDVTIKKNKKEDSGETDKKYSVTKKSGDISYSDDKKTLYVEYKVELKLKEDMQGPLELKDLLTATDFSYAEDSLKITSDNGTIPEISWKANQSGDNNTKKADITVGNAQSAIPAGTYTITYKVKNEKIMSSASSVKETSVKNAIEFQKENETIKSDTTKKITKDPVNKTGKLTVGADGNTYIEWTVLLNGDPSKNVIPNLEKGAKFEDTLASNLELVGDVTVDQYDVTGKHITTDYANVNGKKITYTTPTGQYYYIIKYRTKVTDADKIPIGGEEKITNTGTATGGLNGSGTAEITIQNHVLSKKSTNQAFKKQEDGKWVQIIDWESNVNVEGSLKGYVYEDYAGLTYDGTCRMTMTQEQLDHIRVTDANGNIVDSSKYTISKSNHKDNNVENGLFVLRFTDDVQGPVTIAYQTTSDVSFATVGSWIQFTNYAELTDGKGNKDTANASTNAQYSHGDVYTIYKYDGNGWGHESSSITLKPGEKTLPWTIVVNTGKTITSDMTVTDVIPENMTFLPDSLSIIVNGGSIKDKVDWKYDETTRMITIKIPASGFTYSQGQDLKSNPVTISYRTEIEESFFTGNELNKKYTNTASVEIDGKKTDSTYTYDVTRQVVGKSGSYDSTNQLLSYNIIVNPEGNMLNNGEKLKVIDKMNAGALAGKVKLNSITAFTAIKEKNDNGNEIIKPGRMIQKLEANESQNEYTYSYDEAANTFVAYLADKEAYVLVAQYEVNADVSEDVTMNNQVEILGNKKWQTDDKNTQVKQDTSGQTYKNQDRITVTKHDSAKYDTVLNNAQFCLEKYENNSWQQVDANLLTGENGKFTKVIERNTLYRLIETKAPEGYILNSTPYYFVLQDEDNPVTLPETIESDNNYSGNKVHVYSVKTGNYNNILIDRYNEEDTTIAKDGEIRVNKVWKDGSGSTVTDAIELSKKPEVKVTLTKHEREKGHTVTIFDGKWPGAHENVLDNLADGCYLVIQLNPWENLNDLTCTDNKVKVTKTDENESIYTIGPIKEDCIIYQGKLAWMDKAKIIVQGGVVSDKVIDTVVGTVSLNNDNNWTYVWKNLSTDDGVTYTLSEESVNGYTTTYYINNKEMTERTTIPVGSAVDVVNTDNDKTYELPSTGGTGTTGYLAGGAALMCLAALLYGYQLRRKRERGTK